jgi:hypothetical protein
MTSDDRNRADARFNKAARAASEAKTVKSDRDVASKAVLDNMAKLKALRLAREAAAPPAAPKKARGKSSAVKSSGKKTAEKGPALGDWLAGQQSGGRRT